MYNRNGETVSYNTEEQTLVIIDQTKLPNENVQLELFGHEEIFEAIRTLQVRGAPAIGVSAAIALSVWANRNETEDEEQFVVDFLKDCDYITASRPTAVNLFWAADEMKKTVSENCGRGAAFLKSALQEKALAMHKADMDVCRKIGEYGAALLKDCKAVLTHCNAGRLAAVKYGTALAPVYAAMEQGHSLRVYADETRPLLQGARLTCSELMEAGVETTLLCDNMASYAMRQGLVDAVLVGCDRVAANGDTANKIGTSGVAVLAKYYGIPFYVCAPFSTIDMSAKTGADIVIEQRDENEVTELWYEKRMAPDGVGVLNPAFDVTEHSLITAFITEKGVLTPEDF